MGKLWELILAIDLGSFAWGAAFWAAIVWLWEHTAGAWTKSRSGELGKLSARLAKLDTLVEETSKLTTTAEKIKATISNEAWTRQATWTMKRDCYFALVTAATELENALVEDYGLRKVTPVPPKREEYEQALRSVGKEIASAWKKLNAAVGIGRLVFDDGAVAAIDKSVPKVGSGADAINSVIALRRALREQSDRELSGRQESN